MSGTCGKDHRFARWPKPHGKARVAPSHIESVGLCLTLGMKVSCSRAFWPRMFFLFSRGTLLAFIQGGASPGTYTRRCKAGDICPFTRRRCKSGYICPFTRTLSIQSGNICPFSAKPDKNTTHVYKTTQMCTTSQSR
jgi:hypothetical protein